MLEKLSELQEIDLEIAAFTAELENVPEELQTLRVTVADLEKQLAHEQATRDELRSELNAIDLELSTLQQRRKEASESAMRAETAKEVSQFQNQELQFGTRVQEVEEDMLPLMEATEAAEERVQALLDTLAEHRPELESLETAEAERVREIDANVAKISGNRDAVAEAIETPLLRLYDQIRHSRGTALAQVVNNARCTGCNVQVPMHVVQKIKRGKDIVRCPSCGRIVWSK